MDELIPQCLIFDCDYWNVSEARAWCQKHGYKLGKLSTLGKMLRFTQRDPALFKAETLCELSLMRGARLCVGLLAPSGGSAMTHSVGIETRRAEARRTASGTVDNAQPISSRPDLASHPARKSGLTFTYDNPNDVGGWIGGMEPPDESWIAFVATNGDTYLWDRRDPAGGVLGKPVLFKRSDLAVSTRMSTERRKCESVPLGDDAANGRFRIFKEGRFKTDYGFSVMTPDAGRSVIKKFRERGNDMMIDLRHFSVSPTATREQSEAMGWILCPNGLEYVDGDGLYAKDVQWIPEVKSGLECKPPKWKYFSPLYDQDKKSCVIIELDNIALTNMPATHGLNRLAAERGKPMDLAQIGALLIALMAAAEETGDEKLMQYRDALVAGLGDQAEAAVNAAQAVVQEGGDTAPPAEGGETEDMYAGMEEEEMAAVKAMSTAMQDTYMAGRKAMAMRAGMEEEDKVAAEGEKPEEKVSAEMLRLMNMGELSQSQSGRQKIVADMRAKGLIAAGGKVEKMLLSPGTSDKTFAEFVANTRSKTVTIGGPTARKLPSLPADTKNGTTTISAELRSEVANLTKKTGSDPKRLLEKLAKLSKKPS